MNLNAVEMFVAVVRAGSLSLASERAGVPLATLSRNIRELESELGVRLLDRSARGAKLTEAGAGLYEHAARGIDIFREGLLAVTSNSRAAKGRLRISIPPSFEPWWSLLAEFQREYPRIQLVVHTTERAVDLALEGVDVALRIGPVKNESLIAKRLARYRHVLVASPALLERFGQPQSLDDLVRYPTGVWVPATSMRRTWRLGDYEFEPQATLIVNDYLHLRELAIAGELLTELPPFLAREALCTKRLTPLLPELPFPEQEVNLLYLRQRYPSSALRRYVDFCGRVAPRVLGRARSDRTQVSKALTRRSVP